MRVVAATRPAHSIVLVEYFEHALESVVNLGCWHLEGFHVFTAKARPRQINA
jgi:hypothetical protein